MAEAPDKRALHETSCPVRRNEQASCTCGAAENSSKVVQIKGLLDEEVSVTAILEKIAKIKWRELYVIGYSDDGCFEQLTTQTDLRDILWLLKEAEFHLLNDHHGGDDTDGDYA